MFVVECFNCNFLHDDDDDVAPEDTFSFFLDIVGVLQSFDVSI